MTRMTPAMSGQWKRAAGQVLTALTALITVHGAQAQAPANPYSYSRSASFTYDAKGRVATETAEPSNLPSCVVTTHGYDTWGNRNTSTVANCAGAVPARQQFAARTTSADYSASTGKFPQASTNALGQVSSALFDARFGVKTSVTDASGLTATAQLDDFGRVIKEMKPDGTSTVTQYCYLPGRVTNTSSNSTGCATSVPADAPADAVSYVHAESRDTANVKMGPYARTYADRLGRTIREVTESFDGASQPVGVKGKLIAKDTVYSPVGTKVMETQPYFLATGSSLTTGANDVGVTRTVYDALGRPTTVYTADPNGLAGAQAFGGTGTSHGNYGSRTASKVLFAYAGLTTTTTNDRGQVRKEEKNVIGLLVRITDPAGGQLAHQHDAFGNLVATKDALQNSITLKYDVLGRKLELNDPDAGLWKYEYDALGQLVWQENANQRAAGTATSMAYDKLGRMTSRVEPEGTGTWSYDKYADNSACNKGAGRLCESSFQRAGTSDIRRTKIYYDNLGRAISDVATVTNGPRMAVAKSYHATTGRLDTKTYPTGVKVQYAYTALGFAHQLKLATIATVNGTAWKNAGDMLWQADVVNAWGKTEQQAWANSVFGRAVYQAATGRTSSLTAGPGTSTSVVNHSYTWDSLNNLTYRADNIGDAVAGAVTETFEYGDGLSRLTKYTVAAPGVPNGSRSVTLQYNALGMLLNKSDVGVYAYGASGPNAIRPHALQSMTDTSGATSYGYDANGNLVTASGGKYRTVSYTSFNLPDGQSGIGGETNGANGGTARYTWLYDEDHKRIKEVRTIAGGTKAGTRTTWYLHPDNAGALGFEQEVNSPTTPTADNPAATNNRHYLSFGGQTLGVLISTGAIAAVDPSSTVPPTATTVALTQVQFWHKDHLGSLIATTNHAGAVTGRYAYDPFGKRRFTNGSYDPFGTIVVDFAPDSATTAGADRGFTEHEHLDDIGLIHMNGRIFDPKLGRFIQSDAHVTLLTELQNYNRYSYCLNNPLTCTDPTGFDVFDTVYGGIGDPFGWNTYNGGSFGPASQTVTIVGSLYGSLNTTGSTYVSPAYVPLTLDFSPVGSGYVNTSFLAGQAQLGAIFQQQDALANASINASLAAHSASLTSLRGPSFPDLAFVGPMIGAPTAPAATATTGSFGSFWPGLLSMLARFLGAAGLAIVPSGLGDSSQYNYYHGADGSAVTSLSQGLDLAAAAKNTNGGGDLGFYLATTYMHAEVYAEDRYNGVVLRYTFNAVAQQAMLAAGAQLRQTMYGRGQEIGGEFYIPPSAFGTFNAMMATGNISITVVPSSPESPGGI
jgi:RHS repeat-associated protein